MSNTSKTKSPEEIMKEIEKLKRQYEAAEVELKESRLSSVNEAVRKASVTDPEFRNIFNKINLAKSKVVSDQKKIEELKADVATNIQYWKDQYKFVVETLVGEGAKQEYLVDVLGEPPTVKAVAAPGTGVGKKRTKAKLPDGTLMTWVELIGKYGIPPVPGANQRLTWESAVKANPNLPKIEVVTGE